MTNKLKTKFFMPKTVLPIVCRAWFTCLTLLVLFQYESGSVDLTCLTQDVHSEQISACYRAGPTEIPSISWHSLIHSSASVPPLNTIQRIQSVTQNFTRPIILQESPLISSWPAFSTISPDYLIQHLAQSPLTPFVKVQTDDPVFRYVDLRRPLGQIMDQDTLISSALQSQIQSKIPRLDHSFTASRLFALLQNSSHPIDSNVYYSTRLLDLGSHVSSINFPSFDFFLSGETPFGKSYSTCDPMTNIWVGGKESVTYNHYDGAYNFYIQIYGRKTFLLSPPSQWRSLHLMPAIHPFFRQTQIDPKQAHEGVEVHLAPGDILFLPALWFHHVTAPPVPEISISVNIWFEPEEITLWNSLIDGPSPDLCRVPHRKSWSLTQRLLAARIYVSELISRVFSLKGTETERISEKVHQIIRYDLWDVKYAVVEYIEDWIDMADEEMKDGCKDRRAGGAEDWEEKEMRKKMFAEEGSPGKERLEKVVNMFEEIQEKIVVDPDAGESVRERIRFHMSNFLEELVTPLLGVQNVAFFWRHCL